MRPPFFPLLFFTLLGIASPLVLAQPVSVSLRGFVRTDVLVDSRQSVHLRESAIYLYPKPIERDAEGRDLNAQPMATMLVLHTRLGLDLAGPSAFGAKSTGMVEGEFFGVSDGDANGFRVRHAYVMLDWGGTSLLAGQFWHPLFPTAVIPTFNLASPFLFYSRNPQVRLTRNMGAWSIAATAWFESDFKSLGPDTPIASTPDPEPVRSTQFIKNAALPGFNLQAQWKDGGLVVGMGGDVKRLVPRLSIRGSAVSAGVTSGAGVLFAQMQSGLWTLKAQGIYGTNMADGTMLGGYGARLADTTTYAPIATAAGWTELVWGRDIKLALFLGYTRNLGSRDALAVFPDDPRRTGRRLYAMSPTMQSAFRVAPSVGVTSGPLRAVFECDITRAEYGIPDTKLRFSSTEAATNVRLVLALLYSF